MSPLAFPQLQRLDDGRWQATCRTCGWQSTPQVAKTAADYSRRLHGPEKTCTHADGRPDTNGPAIDVFTRPPSSDRR